MTKPQIKELFFSSDFANKKILSKKINSLCKPCMCDFLCYFLFQSHKIGFSVFKDLKRSGRFEPF